MIILIQGPQGSGKTRIAKEIALRSAPQRAEFLGEVPAKKPGMLSSLTIYTIQNTSELPRWIVFRKDYTILDVKLFKMLGTEEQTSFFKQQWHANTN